MSRSAMDLYCRELAAIAERCDVNNPDESVLAELEAHVERCPICRGAESQLNEAVSKYRDYDAGGVSQRFEESIVDLLCGAGKKETRSGQD
jgi:hypothetical protein